MLAEPQRLGEEEGVVDGAAFPLMLEEAEREFVSEGVREIVAVAQDDLVGESEGEMVALTESLMEREVVGVCVAHTETLPQTLTE